MEGLLNSLLSLSGGVIEEEVVPVAVAVDDEDMYC
jgi:hypothetical protein